MPKCFDGSAATQQGMLGALIVWWPVSFWVQWTLAEGAVHTGSPAKFPTKPTEEWNKNRKMYAIKQIKICAEYRDMLPRPRLDLSSTPGLRPIGLSPGSWQTSLGLGSMSRYSAQILICIIKTPHLIWRSRIRRWNYGCLNVKWWTWFKDRASGLWYQKCPPGWHATLITSLHSRYHYIFTGRNDRERHFETLTWAVWDNPDHVDSPAPQRESHNVSGRLRHPVFITPGTGGRTGQVRLKNTMQRLWVILF